MDNLGVNETTKKIVGAERGDRQLAGDIPAQGDFFVCDILAAIPKDDMGSMEHPIFSLSTRPDRRVLRYAHGATTIEITPSVKGLATIHDKDVLIYCISQLVAGLNAGRSVSRRLVLKSWDLLTATGRETSGNGYRRLREAFERLSGTRITTNLVTGGVETTTGFGLIDTWQIKRKTRSGRMISVEVTLSDWLYRAVLDRSVLTLSRDYFHLRKPLERRVYEIARKHCGRQAAWKISLEVLLKKTGSTSPRRVFRKMIRDMVEENHLPDYEISLDARDIVHVTARGLIDEGPQIPPLEAAAYDAARAAAPGYDVHALEAEWRAFWARSGRPRLRAPARAFVAFCAKKAQAAPLR